MQEADVIIVGAGLSGCLAALALRASQPNLDIKLIEQAATPAGNHTWCFHAPDLAQGIPVWLEPAIEWRWAGYEVRFPRFVRQFSTSYMGISSEHLRKLISSQFSVMCGTSVRDLDRTMVTLSDGSLLRAKLVLDCRGGFREEPVAYQKFFGLKIRLHKPHGISKPLIMDANVPQLDGFRFIYVLPIGKQELLVEDTRYSDTALIDKLQFLAEIRKYAAANGWHIAAELGEERGALPIPLLRCPQPSATHVTQLGVAAGLFNPATGYSLPDAVRTAEWVAANWQDTDFETKARKFAENHWRSGAYLRRLNNMLFLAAKPGQRRAIMQRFYEHPTPTIERLYAGNLTFKDKLRILCIKPPVTLGAAAKAFTGISSRSAAMQT